LCVTSSIEQYTRIYYNLSVEQYTIIRIYTIYRPRIYYCLSVEQYIIIRIHYRPRILQSGLSL